MIEDLSVQNMAGFILNIVTQLQINDKTYTQDWRVKPVIKTNTTIHFSPLKQKYVKNYNDFLELSNHIGLQSETIHSSKEQAGS